MVWKVPLTSIDLHKGLHLEKHIQKAVELLSVFFFPEVQLPNKHTIWEAATWTRANSLRWVANQ